MTSSSSGWRKCRVTLAIVLQLGWFVRSESKFLKLTTTLYSSRNCFLIRRHKQPGNLNNQSNPLVISISSAGVLRYYFLSLIRLHTIHRLLVMYSSRDRNLQDQDLAQISRRDRDFVIKAKTETCKFETETSHLFDGN